MTDAATKRTAHLHSQEIAELGGIIERMTVDAHKRADTLKMTISGLRERVKALKQHIRRSIRTLARKVDRARKKFAFQRVTSKGVYTVQARQLARVMVDSGCAPAKVGPLMACLASAFGVHIDREMDRRTVRRAIAEGGVAAKMQAVYELAESGGELA